MTLEQLGYRESFESFRHANGLSEAVLGRVSTIHRNRYIIKTTTSDISAELPGSYHYQAASRSELPAVGDWVALNIYEENKAFIQHIFPRFSVLQRQEIGKSSQAQIIATNIDYALIVQSLNRDFNINRLERYLALCHTANILPLIILTKIDLVTEAEVQSTITILQDHFKQHIPIIPVSTVTHQGVELILPHLEFGKTYCLLGSSGVGKSSLINTLLGRDELRTGAISEHIPQGKHVTTHRELIILSNGALCIDNPGMRELGMTESHSGITDTFQQISDLSLNCKFSDCSHTVELGCAVLQAVQDGEIQESTLNHYHKIHREREQAIITVREQKRTSKNRTKIYKEAKAIKKKSSW